jgi:hypothetical protein
MFMLKIYTPFLLINHLLHFVTDIHRIMLGIRGCCSNRGNCTDKDWGVKISI